MNRRLLLFSVRALLSLPLRPPLPLPLVPVVGARSRLHSCMRRVATAAHHLHTSYKQCLILFLVFAVPWFPYAKVSHCSLLLRLAGLLSSCRVSCVLAARCRCTRAELLS